MLLDRNLMNNLLYPESRKKEAIKAQKLISSSDKLDSLKIAEAWAVLGEVYKCENEPLPSEEAYLKCIEAIRAMNDKNLLGVAFISMGDALLFCKKFEKAIFYYDQAIEISEAIKETDRLIHLYSQISYCFAKVGDREKEQKYLSGGIQLRNIPEVVRANFIERLALSLESSGEYRLAVDRYEEALLMYESEDFKRNWQERIDKLANIYHIIGDEESASRTRKRM